jgi:PemK-like, MazF-like toxin of type II toxin-antitoxin system
MPPPNPTLGLVISYSFLWTNEHNTGQTEGVKDRPCVIVLAIDDGPTGAKTVTVAPMTHSPPDDTKNAIEIPLSVKKALGLDEAPSWVVVNDTNEFVWPGFDLRPISRGRYHYGHLPPRLFAKIADAVARHWSEGAGKPVPR